VEPAAPAKILFRIMLVVSEVPPPPQVGHFWSSVIFPVPWHRGHATLADAKFKTEKRRMVINEIISALFFMSYFSPAARISFQLDTFALLYFNPTNQCFWWISVSKRLFSKELFTKTFFR
jgi:hypothetical protein